MTGMSTQTRLGWAAPILIVVGGACGLDPSEPASGVVACGARAPVVGRPLNIVTTVAPITSIVANVVGDTGAKVTGLVPEGVDSHTFEPPPSAAEALAVADEVFVNGLGLEDPVRDLAAANLGAGAEICELATTVLPESEWIYDFSFPEAGGRPNPHLWTNPPMAKEYAALVRSTLAARDPANAAAYEANFSALAERIDALDAAVRQATNTLPAADRKLLTYHDAYAYFAREYGWEVVGAIQPSSFAEPSPKDLAALIGQIRDQGVKAVFGSEVFPSPVLEQLGAETGVRYVDVLRDDDLPGKPGEPEHSWLGLMRFDVVTLVDSLGGDASALRALDIAGSGTDSAYYPQ